VAQKSTRINYKVGIADFHLLKKYLLRYRRANNSFISGYGGEGLNLL